MSSDLQQIASRTNGAKSRGPLTEAGKQASSQNSLAHGFNSKRVVLAGEWQEEFDELLTSFLDEHQPETPTERTFIENMAIARWRQQRVWTLETAGLTAEMRRPRYMEGDDPETQAFVAFRTLTDDTRALELLNRYEARFERQFRAALTAFLTLRAKRQAEHKPNHPDKPDPAAPVTKRVKLYWVDEEGNRTLQANTHPDPEPQPELPIQSKPASGSFGNLKNPPVTDISQYKQRSPITETTP